MFLFRMLAFPLVRKGDLLVDPPTDRRWIVDQVDFFSLKGAVPVAQNVSVYLAGRDNAVYRVPVPQLQPYR